MYAYITLNEWIQWVKTHNNEFAAFLREVGTPYLFGAKPVTFSSDVPGFFIPLLAGWVVRYNPGLRVSVHNELIELHINEIV